MPCGRGAPCKEAFPVKGCLVGWNPDPTLLRKVNSCPVVIDHKSPGNRVPFEAVGARISINLSALFSNLNRGKTAMPFVSTTITVDDRTITTTFDAATNSYNLSIPENSAAGIGIGNGKVEFKGRGPAETLYTLLGPDAARVRLADDGTLTLATGVELDCEANGGPPAFAITIDALFIGDDPDYDDDSIVDMNITTGDTPLGPYNSDWAFVTNDDRLYFACETKESLDNDDLKNREKAKIACAERYFRNLDVEYRSVTSLGDSPNVGGFNRGPADHRLGPGTIFIRNFRRFPHFRRHSPGCLDRRPDAGRSLPAGARCPAYLAVSRSWRCPDFPAG